MLILFIVIVFLNILYFKKSFNHRDNKDIIMFFSFNFFSLVCIILYTFLSVYNSYVIKSYLFNLWYFLITLLLVFLIFIVRIILIIFKKRSSYVMKRKLEKKEKIKAIFLPFLVLLLLFVIFFIIDIGFSYFKTKEKLRKYDEKRTEEILKMVNFINKKYNINVSFDNCIYYREEDYNKHTDFLGNGYDSNIPYIGLFEYNNEKITVVDRKGILSDNYQLSDINELIIDYFYDKTGIKFDYIEFEKSYYGSYCGDDNIINYVLQEKFNSIINKENISKFIDEILKVDALSIEFYTRNNNEQIRRQIAENLSYLKNYENIEKLEVNFNINELTITHKEKEFPEEHYNYGNNEDDYDDRYKFGCIYIDNKNNPINYSMRMDLNRGYSTGKGEDINGWVYIKIESSES